MEKLEYKRSGTSSNKKKSDVKKSSTKKKNNIEEKVESVKKNKVKKSNKSKRIVVIVMIFVLVIAAAILLCTLPYFNATIVNVEGTSKYTKEEILQKSGISINRNIFIQAFSGVSSSINELPYIESANVSLKLPNEIKITVKDRKSMYFAFNEEKNTYYKIDGYGVILEEGNIQEKQNTELLVHGFIFDDEVIFGSKIKEIDISKIEIYDNIKKEFEKNQINGSITKVNFANSLTTITLNDKLNVIFPNDTDIKYKMSFLKSILAKIGEDSSGVIDMTKTNPVFSNY